MAYRKQAFLNTVGLIILLFADWFLLQIMPHLCGYYFAGVYSYSLGVSNIFYTISCFGIRNYQVICDYDKVTEPSFFSAYLYSTLISLVLSILYAFFFVSDRNIMISFLIIMMFQSTTALAMSMISSMQKIDRLDIVGINGIICGIVKILTFLLSFQLLHNYQVALLSMVCISTLLYWLFIRVNYVRITQRRTSFSFYNNNCKELRIIWKECFPLFAYSIVMPVISATTKIFIEKLLNAEMLGIYAVLSSVTVLVPSLANGLFAPLITKLNYLAKEKKYGTLLKEVIIYLAIFVGIFTMLMLISNKFVINLMVMFYGVEIEPYTKVYTISMWAMFLCAIVGYISPVWTILGKNKDILIISIAMMVLNFFISFSCVRNFGLIGAAISSLVAFFLMVLIMVSGAIIQLYGLKRGDHENDKL